MLNEIRKDYERRSEEWVTPDEVRIAWLLGEVDRLNGVISDAKNCLGCPNEVCVSSYANRLPIWRPAVISIRPVRYRDTGLSVPAMCADEETCQVYPTAYVWDYENNQWVNDCNHNDDAPPITHWRYWPEFKGGKNE